MQQEELARLFSANLNLAQAPPQHPQFPQPEQQVTQGQSVQSQQEQEPVASPPITYVSQHYTHSYHVAPVRNNPPSQTHFDASELESILLRNSIDPSLLFPSQVDLFQNADNDQRLRLLELWRISPPQGRQGAPDGMDYSTSRQLYDWPPTSLAQEEAMAKLRYEKQMEEQAQAEDIARHQVQLDQSMDDGQVDSAAVQATRDLLTSSPNPNAEPYIVSGYDMLAKREYEESCKASNESHLRESTKYNQATDPAYQGSGKWEKNVGSVSDMENQYGAFAQARDYDVQPVYVDDEMVM